MYLDFKTDESYTPNKISVRAGNNLQDLKVCNFEQNGAIVVAFRTLLISLNPIRI